MISQELQKNSTILNNELHNETYNCNNMIKDFQKTNDKTVLKNITI